MDREQKKAEVKRITDLFERAEFAVFADYRGVNVADFTALRRQLREAGVSCRVVKNRLTKLAASSVFKDSDREDLEKLLSLLEGPNCMFVSFDTIVEPSKILAKFARDNENLKIRGGWVEGGFVGEEGILEFSRMPSREEVLAKLLRLMNAPAEQLLRLMSTPARQVVQLLAAHKNKLEE